MVKMVGQTSEVEKNGRNLPSYLNFIFRNIFSLDKLVLADFVMTLKNIENSTRCQL